MRGLSRSRRRCWRITIGDVNGEAPLAACAAPNSHELPGLHLTRQPHVRSEPVCASYDCQIPGCTHGDFLGIELMCEARQLRHEVAIKGPDRHLTDQRR
jgi:hypothetical protein